MTKNVEILYKKFYLDRRCWVDGTAQFKILIQSYLDKSYEIIDLGAGNSSVHNYKGAVRNVVGVDINDTVFLNSKLDEAYKCSVTEMPFKNNRFDLAYADWLLEHLSDPIKSAKEIYRVLKPNGVLIIRTPNLWHYVSLISCCMPYKLHIILRKLLLNKDSKDTIKTYYRCNNILKIKRIFEKAGFITEELEMVEKEPSYLMTWEYVFMLGLAYERLVNSMEFLKWFRANIFAVFRKPNVDIVSSNR